ncbi:hypothetical protein N9L92_04530 [Saprospiraceae bacterium]|nr:hypothetical protein [Saprospiraceae bacterium]
MNYLKLLPFLLISLLIISCGDDDPLSTTIIDSTFELESIERTGCDDPDRNIELTSVDENNCVEADDELICNFTFRFIAGGVVTFQSSSDGDVETETLSYTVNDDNNEVTIFEGASIPDPLIGTIDGDEATFTFTDDGCLIVFNLEKA